MPASSNRCSDWLSDWMEAREIKQHGVADLGDFETPRDETGRKFSFSVSFAVPMNPEAMASIRTGPTLEYADEYSRVNKIVNEISTALAWEIREKGFRASALAASERTDPVNLKGDFPQKTAATRAGMGWIGRNCQLVTRMSGPWVRLGTVFTDLSLACGRPAERSFCGRCGSCVDACPAKALTGATWRPGIPREKILDAAACDRYKKEHFFRFHKGRNCGICAAVCPYGLKTLKIGRR